MMTERNPLLIKCPICEERGRLNDFKPKGGSKTEYYIGHEQLDNKYWGTKVNQKVQAIRRCYLKKPYHRQWAKNVIAGVQIA